MVVPPPSKRRNTTNINDVNDADMAGDDQNPRSAIDELQARLEELTLQCRAQNQIIEDLRYGPMSICASKDTRNGHPCRNVRSRCHLRFNGDHTDHVPDHATQHEQARLCGSILTKSGKPCRNRRSTCHLLRSGVHD